MNDALQAAMKCFQEGSETDEFNLYNGLALLAEGVGKLEDSIYQLSADIEGLKSQLRFH